jgi:hypothetical protein
LRQDPGNRLASLGNVNFANLGSLADPFACIMMELADADRFHVTHCVTSLQICQLARAKWFPDSRSASPGKSQLS